MVKVRAHELRTKSKSELQTQLKDLKVELSAVSKLK
jgi:ribosomal protein L29